jgi:hypothetical protein
VHRRIIDMEAYAREDGLYDVEAHLVDTKPFEFVRLSAPRPLAAGEPLHDLWIRMTVDDNYEVRAIEAASDVTPHGICKEAETTLSVLVGERLVRGWSAKVKERLRGAASCTHLIEVLIPGVCRRRTGPTRRSSSTVATPMVAVARWSSASGPSTICDRSGRESQARDLLPCRHDSR